MIRIYTNASDGRTLDFYGSITAPCGTSDRMTVDINIALCIYSDV